MIKKLKIGATVTILADGTMLEAGPVKSPSKYMTEKQLKNLKENSWHNPDTGTEISEEEGEDLLMRLQQKKADRELEKMLKKYG